jgi:hypothetical protein
MLHWPITSIMTKKAMLRARDAIATNFAGLEDVVIYQIPKVFTELHKQRAYRYNNFRLFTSRLLYHIKDISPKFDEKPLSKKQKPLKNADFRKGK